MNKIAKMVLASVIALIIFIALITGANILFFWSIFNGIQNIIHVATGMDENLAKLFASLAVAGVTMVPFGQVALSFTPIPQKNKKLYRSLICTGVGVFFIFMYFGTRDVYFSPETGKPMKYYSERPNGEFYTQTKPGFDPLTGDSLLPVTKEVIIRIKGLVPKKVEEVPTETPTTSQAPYYPNPEPTVYETSAPIQKEEITKPEKEYNSESKLAEETKTAEVKYERVSVCRVIIKNTSDENWGIFDLSKKEIIRVSPGQDIITTMTPGQYYVKPIENNDYEHAIFEVPRAKGMIMTVGKSNMNLETGRPDGVDGNLKWKIIEQKSGMSRGITVTGG